MANRRFEMYEYRNALVRMRLGDSDRQIAAAKLMGRRKAGELRQLATAHGWLDTSRPLPDDSTLAAVLARKPAPVPASSRVQPYRDQVKRWWEAGIQGTTIHEALVRNHHFQGSYSSVRRFIQGLESRDPKATVILDFAPGEAAQVDFGTGPLMACHETGELKKTWFFVMTLCYSRHQYAEVVHQQTVETWLLCHRRAFEWFGGVVARVTIDNPKCAITRACVRDPDVQRAYAEYAEVYGFRIDPCPPGDPAKKGRVEAGVKYIKRSFLPLREFRHLQDANQQLQRWVLESAGNRIHGRTRHRPLAQFKAVEKPHLKPLPDVAPTLATWHRVKVHRDAHVQHEKRLYSVPFRLMGQRLWLKATPATIQLYREHELVATHTRLDYAGQRSTVDDHMPPEALAYKLRDPQWCLAEAERIGPHCRVLVQRLFDDRVLENLRAVQGIVRLQKKYGAARLEAACERALSFDNPRYRAVKTILEKGLDQHPDLTQSFDELSSTYTGRGRFSRDTRRLLSH